MERRRRSGTSRTDLPARSSTFHTPGGGAPDAGTVCSSRYGDAAANGLTYVGPCDASSDTGERAGVQNDVTLWVDGLYAGGADVGDWRDPCPAGCTLEVDCAPRLATLKIVEPARRSAGITVPDAATLVAKLRNEAKVI